MAQSKYSIGQAVIVRGNANIIGTVIKDAELKSGNWRYVVYFLGGMKEEISEIELEAIAESDSVDETEQRSKIAYEVAPGIHILDTRHSEPISGTSIGGFEGYGNAYLFEVLGLEEDLLELNYIHWQNDEREISIESVRSNESHIRYLESHGKRLKIDTLAGKHAPIHYCALRQARGKGTNRKPSPASLHWSSLEVLNGGAGLDVYAALMSAGALEVGTREDLIGSTDKFNKYYCATFSPDDLLVPVVAYVLTRILPLYNHYKP